MSGHRPPTQVFSRRKLASATTPPFVAEAEQLLEQGDHAGARGKLEEGLRTGGRSVEGLLGLAESFWDDPDTKSRDPKRSIDFLKEAIQLAPKDARPYALLGRYLLSKGLRDQALNFLDRAIQLDPADGASRRLRDRASLQKKKAYTVVVNAKDFGVPKDGALGAGPSPPSGAPLSLVQQAKREATRFLQVDPARAAAELEKAGQAAGNEVDAALAALLGADMVRADVSILKGEAQRRGGNIVRTVVAFLVVIIAGVVFGAALQRVAPAGAASASGVPSLVASDTPSSLTKALEVASQDENEGGQAWSALAHALLLVEHGADEGHLQSVEDALAAANGPERRSPPALLARALISAVPLAEDDDELAADLDATAGDPKQKDDPYLLMALAEGARAEGDMDEAVDLLSRAGLGTGAPPRATHQLARAFAARGDLALAAELLKRLFETHPRYTPGLATGVAVDAALMARAGEGGGVRERARDDGRDDERADDARDDDARDDDDDDDDDVKRRSSRKRQRSQREEALELTDRPAVKRALSALDTGTLDPADAAAVALVLAAVASGTGDDDLHGRMLQRAQEGDVEERFPGLLSRLAQLILLDVGDYTKVETMLSDGLRTFPGEIRLLVDRTRARVGRGLSSDRIRKLRTNADRSLDEEGMLLPVGRFQLDFNERYLPLRPIFDAQVFPEDAIRNALDIKGLTAQAAERRLDVVANLKLAQLSLAQGDVDAAKDRVALARKEAGSDPEVHLTEALVQSKSGNSVRARDAIEEALRMAPDDPRVLVAAARLQVEAGDMNAARRSLARVVEEGFVSPAAVALEARIAVKERRYADARALLTKARKMAPSDVNVLLAALAAEHGAGDFDAGLGVARELRPALGDAADRFGDSDVVTAAYLAWADADAGDTDDAIEDLNEMLEVRAGFAEGHYILGRVLERMGEKDRARESYGQAVKTGGATGVAQAATAALARLDGKPPPGEVQQPTQKPKQKKKTKRRRRR